MTITKSDIDKNKNGVLSVAAFTKNPTVRYMLEISLDPDTYKSALTDSDSAFVRLVESGEFDVCLIDTTAPDSAVSDAVFKRTTAIAANHLLRILVLVDRIPSREDNYVETFGAVCFLEYFFSRKRLERALRELANMEVPWSRKRDTGCRVKGDDKFFRGKGFANG